VRRFVGLLVLLPILAGSSLAAHELGYRTVYPDDAVRAYVLHESGHGYLRYWAAAAGIGAALLLLGLALLVRRSATGAAAAAALPGALALLPVVAFTVQEHVERAIHQGEVSRSLMLEMPFLVGLLLQGPLAIVGLALGRVLVYGAELLGSSLRVAPPRFHFAVPVARAVFAVDLPAPAALARGTGVRGPPRFLD
jgi:hypothetical protein